jgi:uncharacterized protein YegJ (DUF2314 family)
MSFIDRIKSWGRRAHKKETPLVSVVLLLHEPLNLTEQRLHSAIRNAWGRDTREEDNEHVLHKPSVCIVKFEEMVLLINNVRQPYVTEEYRQNQASTEFKEKRQLRAVMEHRAFFTVDLMNPENPKRKVRRDCYKRMCTLAAEFVDNNCMAVSLPETGQFRPYDADLKNALKSDDPLAALARWVDVPVIMLEEDDPKLRAAAEEARTRWPEFVEAFHSHGADQLFSVKAPFRDGDDVEWMWIRVSEIEVDAVEGNLANTPVSLRNIREGDHVRTPISLVADWIYSHGRTYSEVDSVSKR